MDGEIIKSFLVGLGFGVDESSLAKFNKAIASASVRVAALYGGIQIAAVAIFKGIADISSSFEDLGYKFRLVAPAVNKFLILRQAMISTYAAAGINLSRAVQQSIKFNLALDKTKIVFDAIYKSVGLKFIPILTKQMDIFRGEILANMPKIQEALIKFVTFIFKAFSATVELGERIWSILGRVWYFFQELDEATGGWATKLFGFIAAWKLLNLEFLATPLGAIISALVILLALYDDFKGQAEGKKSFFDWTAIRPQVQGVLDIFSLLLDVVLKYEKLQFDLFRDPNLKTFLADLKAVENSFLSISTAVDKLIHSFNVPILDKLLSLRDSADRGILSAFSGSAAQANLGGALQPQPLTSHSGEYVRNISMSANVNITGVSDPQSVGHAVSGSLTDVHANITRNSNAKSGITQ